MNGPQVHPVSKPPSLPPPGPKAFRAPSSVFLRLLVNLVLCNYSVMNLCPLRTADLSVLPKGIVALCTGLTGISTWRVRCYTGPIKHADYVKVRSEHRKLWNEALDESILLQGNIEQLTRETRTHSTPRHRRRVTAGLRRKALMTMPEPTRTAPATPLRNTVTTTA